MRKHRNRVIGASLLAFALLGAACGDSGDDAADPVEGPAIVIGAQDFGESAILAEIYQGALAAEGFTVSVQAVGGFRDLEMAAFDGDDINLAPEYAASMLEFLNDFAGEATGDAEETTDLLNGYLAEEGLVALEPSDAVDTNAFVVTQETSESLGIGSLSELAANGTDLVLGGPPDCETNAFCIPGLNTTYGLDMSANFQPLDAGQVTVAALEEGAIDVAVLFSTSGIIADREWVLLEDDQQMLAADNVVPVITTGLAEAYGDRLADVLNDVSSRLTTDALTEMNRRYDIDTEDADVIAADWLADNDL
ncbi:MAG: ABC transporter substrate-binding protein [Actinomycetota bacterium]|nr:ABC transporter substrate-binding protein [Actinomycetota bacterium]